METEPTRMRLRSSTLWVPGVLAVVLGTLIHTHVAALQSQARRVAENAVACSLLIDLNGRTTQEAAFVPAVSRRFVLSLVLRTTPAGNADQSLPADDFPANAIAKSLEAATFTVAWQLRSEGQSDIEGVFSEKDLHTRIRADEIRYVFGDRELPLKAGRSYTLVTSVAGSAPELNDFAPTLVLRTSSPLKGHPLARWRLKDTGLLLFLGGSLIALGLSKRYSDRKRRRVAAAASATSAE